ncbi:ABC transporter transmembrane region family protein, partial [Vibrio parahaemolyticus V-223/04]
LVVGHLILGSPYSLLQQWQVLKF